MLIKLINSSSVREDLFTKIIIKAISDLIKTIKTIQIINNDYKSIKIIKKTLISRY